MTDPMAVYNTAEELEQLLVRQSATVREVLANIDASGWGIAFVIDDARRLEGIVTDGDVRRALLRGAGIDENVAVCLNRNCVTATTGLASEDLLKLMDYRVRCVPIIDSDRQVVDFAAFEQIYRVPVAEPDLRGRELEYVLECITTNWISSQGKFVDRLESEFARFCDAKFAIATSNGTTALHLALVALGVGSGDEVIVPDLTFIATANAVTYCGAKPVLVDVDLETWTISPKEIEAAVTSRTKGIIPVHLYGHPADMDPILAIAARHHLFVLEDCAEALGARYRSRIVGSLGTASCFSFYGNKTLTTGEGGMVVTNDDTLYRKARMLRDHGMSPERRYWHPLIGFNYRLTNLQAAVGCAQLERVDEIFARKRRIDQLYRQRLSEISGLVMPPAAPWAEPVCWLFSALVDETNSSCTRDALLRDLEARKIGCRPLFIPLHEQPPYARAGRFSAAEALSRSGVSFPSAVSLKEKEIEYICRTIASLMSAANKSR